MNMTNEELAPVNEKPTIAIIGDPGAGKTRLASLYPDAYFLDAEGGAASAVPPERRKSFEIGKTLLQELKVNLAHLIALKYENKRILLDGMPIGAVVIDSLDAIQQVYKYENLLEGGTKIWREPRQMWGKLLDDMIPLVFLTKKLKVPTIWIAHVKTEDPVYNYEQLRKPGWRGIAAQGALEDQIMRWFDYVLHLYVEEDYKRTCITQPTIYRDYKITAKDRHYTFSSLGKNRFPIAVDDATGFPVTKVLQVIYDRHVY
jgi:hypothetical protein